MTATKCDNGVSSSELSIWIRENGYNGLAMAEIPAGGTARNKAEMTTWLKVGKRQVWETGGSGDVLEKSHLESRSRRIRGPSCRIESY